MNHMEIILIIIASSVVALFLGGAVGYLIRKATVARTIGSAEKKAQDLITEAKAKQRELLLRGKDRR